MHFGVLLKWVAFVMGGLGIAAIITGAVLGFAVLPNNILDEVEKLVRLEYNTSQFERWENLEFNQQMKVYLFEIVNADAIQNEQARPIVVERGPYVYSLSREKTVVGRNPVIDTITYYEVVKSTFDAIASGDNKEDDNILMLNAPLMSVLQSLEHWPSIPNIADEIAEAFPTSANIFQKFSVRELLFDGFRFCPNPNQAPQVCRGNLNYHNYFQRNDDESVSFAVLRHRENSNDGLFEITAGMHRIQELGCIQSWRGSNMLEGIWQDYSDCSFIRGRDSTIFPPNVQRYVDFDIFYPDMCRVFTLSHFRNEDYGGIAAHRRKFIGTTLESEWWNFCFCTEQTKPPEDFPRQCWPIGFLDLFTCTGAHIVLSYPHFLEGYSYQHLVQGLNPNENDHGSYTIIEPGTGTALKIVRRFQYNMVLRPIEGVAITEGMPRAVVPLFWIEETMELPQHLVNKIHDEYESRWRRITIITWVLIGMGIAIYVASVLLKIFCC